MRKIAHNDFSVSGPENLAWAKKWLIPDIIISLKKKVKVDQLNDAVMMAMKLHPLYQTMLIQNKRGEPIRIRNTKFPVIKKFNPKEPILYGTDKYNNYSWLIRYTNSKIIISISHMLSDGTGALNFIKSVLQSYFEKTGELPENYSKADIRLAYTTTENSYLKYGKGKVKRPKVKENEAQAIKVNPKILQKDKENLGTYRIVIEKKRIKELSSRYNVRPVTVTAALFAKALGQTLNLQSGIIDMPIPVNCRNYFPSNTDRNFIYAALLKYNIGKMQKSPLKSVVQELNKQFEKSVTKDNMKLLFREVSDLTKIFKQSVKVAYGIRKNATKTNNDRIASICYSHITHINMPAEFDDFIKNIEVAALPPREGSVVYIFGLNFKDRITFSVKHIFKKNMYIKNLIDVLKKEKIQYTLSKSRHQCLAKFYTVK